MTFTQTLQRYETQIRGLARWMVYALMAIPLVVGNSYFFPFIVPKYLVFRTVVELLVLAYLLLRVANPGRYQLRMNVATWGLLAYGASAVLSGLVGVDWHYSFFGTFERMEGIFTTLHYLALFLVLPALLNREEWVKLLRVTVGVSVVLSIYGLAQKLGANWTVEAGRDRISSTIGNPAYVGAYLLFHLGFAAYLLVRDWASKLRWLWVAVLALLLVTFVLTLTRGAMLGLLAALPVVAVAWLWLTRASEGVGKVARGLVVGALALVVAIPVLLVVFKNSALVTNQPILHRFAEISLSAGTAQTRFYTWNSAWQGIKERPLLGWGPEQFPVPFNQHFNPAHYRGPNSETWFDHAHNIILDIGVTQGAVGVAAWLVFIGGLLALAWRRSRDGATRGVGLVTLGVLVAYVLQNMFLFDVLVVWLVLAVLGGLLVSYQPTPPAGEGTCKAMPWRAAAAVYAALLVLALLPINWRTGHISRSIIVAKQGDTIPEAMPQQLEFYKTQIFDRPIGTGAGEAARQLGTSALYHLQRNDFQAKPEQREPFIGLALQQLQDSVEDYPYDLQTQLSLAKMVAIDGELSGDAAKYDEAVEIIEAALERSPQRIELLADLALYRAAQKRDDESIAIYRRILDLIPNVPYGKWMLGTALVRSGQLEEGQRLVEESLQNEDFKLLVYGQSYMLQRLVDLYISVESWPKLVETYTQMLTINPERADVWGSLALAFQKLEDYDRAISAAEKAMELEPRYAQQANELIAELKKEQAAAARGKR